MWGYNSEIWRQKLTTKRIETNLRVSITILKQFYNVYKISWYIYRESPKDLRRNYKKTWSWYSKAHKNLTLNEASYRKYGGKKWRTGKESRKLWKTNKKNNKW